jgi:hypothetical protein
VKPREKRLVIALGAVAAVAAFMTWVLPHKGPVAVSMSATPDTAPEAVPRIDLERLPHERPTLRIGRRDIFAFGPPPTLPPTPRPSTTPPPTPDPQEALVATPVPGPRLPPLTLKYIGSVENGRGARVAVLLTDRNELLTGQAGEVVANRYKIARIGLESVDLEEVGTGQVKRIPLKN